MSHTQQVKNWFASKNLTVDYSNKKQFYVYQNGELILHKKTNSFFRSAHLETIINQTCKLIGIENDFQSK